MVFPVDFFSKEPVFFDDSHKNKIIHYLKNEMTLELKNKLGDDYISKVININN